jgi:hypothetical protein
MNNYENHSFIDRCENCGKLMCLTCGMILEYTHVTDAEIWEHTKNCPELDCSSDFEYCEDSLHLVK